MLSVKTILIMSVFMALLFKCALSVRSYWTIFGSFDGFNIYPREVVKRALEIGATALILVHNHPSGDATPSRADIEMTKKIAAAAEPLGIVLHDHLIITRSEEASFRTMGLI